MSAGQVLGVKSKFGVEFRRFSIDPSTLKKFDDFYALLEKLHQLSSIPFVVQYVAPDTNCFLPINNDKNFAVALSKVKHLLRILLQRKGESYGDLYGYSASKPSKFEKSAASALLSINHVDKHKPTGINITLKDDFQLVCSVLDANILPREMRRVRLVRTPNKQLGLYIRDGVSTRLTESGYETVPAFFISRLDKDGIAYNTGLLAENDELIEVNGIEVFGKKMDQVTDMMVANSANLIITVRPSDQAGSHLRAPLLAPASSQNTAYNAYQAESTADYRNSLARQSQQEHQQELEEFDTDEEDYNAGLITL